VSYGASLMKNWQAILPEAIPVSEEVCTPVVLNDIEKEQPEYKSR
jgi:hypothetical protein